MSELITNCIQRKLWNPMATSSCCGMPDKENPAPPVLTQLMECSILSSESAAMQNLYCIFLIWRLLSLCQPLKWNHTLATHVDSGRNLQAQPRTIRPCLEISIRHISTNQNNFDPSLSKDVFYERHIVCSLVYMYVWSKNRKILNGSGSLPIVINC